MRTSSAGPFPQSTIVVYALSQDRNVDRYIRPNHCLGYKATFGWTTVTMSVYVTSYTKDSVWPVLDLF